MYLGVTSAIRIDFEGERGAIFGQRTAIFAQLMEQLLEIENVKNSFKKNDMSLDATNFQS
jgi:hypothetical protein